MVAFYLNIDKQENKIKSLTNEQVTVIVWMSIFYHAVFIGVTVLGVGLYAFDRDADGRALEGNTAAVVAIMGLFSIFLAPVAFLFASPNEAVEARRGGRLTRKKVAAPDGEPSPKEK